MSDFATIIGWIVIIGFAIFLIGSFVGWINKQERENAGAIIAMKNTACRIAVRHIYAQTNDPKVKEMVKRYANDCLYGWALLDLDLTDNQFLSSHSKLGSYEAQFEITKKGFPLELEGGEIIQRW